MVSAKSKGKSKLRGLASGKAMGRPSSYRPAFAEITRRMVGAGATEAEIGARLDCSVMTLWRWRGEHPEFAEAFKLAKEAAADRVVGAMFHRAVGYTYPSEKIVVVDKKVERVPIKEHVPPDVTAGQFLLTNLRPTEWRNRQQVEMGAPGEFDRLGDDELRHFIEAEAAQVVGTSKAIQPARVVAPAQATGIAPLQAPSVVAAPRRGRPRKVDVSSSDAGPPAFKPWE